MEKFIFQDIKDLNERKQAIMDNAETAEQKTYNKPLTEEQVETQRQNLLDAVLKKQELEEEEKEYLAGMKQQIDAYSGVMIRASSLLRTKSQLITEECYKLVDETDRRVGYYNSEGMLVDERPARQNELQPRLFAMKPTGTESNASN